MAALPQVKTVGGGKFTGLGGLGIAAIKTRGGGFVNEMGVTLQGFDEAIELIQDVRERFDQDVAYIAGAQVNFELPETGSRSNNTKGMDWGIEFGHFVPDPSGGLTDQWIEPDPYIRPALQKLRDGKLEQIIADAFDNGKDGEWIIKEASRFFVKQAKEELKGAEHHDIGPDNPLLNSIGFKKVNRFTG